MNVFAHSRNVNASRANITHVEGDQIIYNGPTTINYCDSARSRISSGSVVSHYCPRSSSSQPIIQVTTNTELRKKLPTTYCSADAIAATTTAIRLIDCILDSLTDHTDSSNDHCDVKHKLETLRLTLSLTECAIFAYHGRLLGPSLDSAITPEVERCIMILSELRDEINTTWTHLIYTSIHGLWRQVWQRRWDSREELELAALKGRLDNSGNMLGMFLMALNSYVYLFATHRHLLRHQISS
jgi:hypothetical protein